MRSTSGADGSRCRARGTRLGTAAVLRESFVAAQNYQAKRAAMRDLPLHSLRRDGFTPYFGKKKRFLMTPPEFTLVPDGVHEPSSIGADELLRLHEHRAAKRCGLLLLHHFEQYGRSRFQAAQHHRRKGAANARPEWDAQPDG